MNRNIVFAAIILVVVATAYSFLSLDTSAGKSETEPGNILPEQASHSAPVEPTPAQTAEQQRREAMRAEYAKLEQARDDVRKQLAILKSRLWKLRVPPDRARMIQKQTRQGHVLLKNPPLAGAFSSVDEITREIEKVEGVSDSLKALEVEIEEYLSAR